MKAEVKEGVEEGVSIINLKANSSDEADLLETLFRNGVRVVSGSRWGLSIADPKLANVKAFYFNPEEMKIIHHALTKEKPTDKVMHLLRSLYPDI